VLSKPRASFIPQKFRRQIANRIIDIPQKYLVSNIKTEFKSILLKKILKRNTTENYFAIHSDFQKSIPVSLVKKADLVIGYDSSSWILAPIVKKLNKTFILERTITHHIHTRKIYAQSLSMYPDWSEELSFTVTDEHLRIENLELEVADYVTVGSEFVKNSLIESGVNPGKIYINPYGINVDFFEPKKPRTPNPLRFLFFGTISARKGIPTLLNAWKKLAPHNAVLTLAGYGNIPSHIQLPDNVEVIGKILPENRNALYDSADVFVFPSILEGFAQVLIEAAASGLPIITTPNSGGGDIVTEGVNGFLINATDENALAEKLQFFIDHPEQASIMGNSRLAEIRERFSLKAYEQRWLDLLALASKKAQLQ
jgi:glycosyltransferase involved in cell wall biosynthesis